jgi:hypothetical protein
MPSRSAEIVKRRWTVDTAETVEVPFDIEFIPSRLEEILLIENGIALLNIFRLQPAQPHADFGDRKAASFITIHEPKTEKFAQFYKRIQPFAIFLSMRMKHDSRAMEYG